jgi:hypothetical protein
MSYTDPDSNTKITINCGLITTLLRFAFFVYLMVAYSVVLKVNDAHDIYVQIINWIIVFSITYFVVIGLFFLFSCFKVYFSYRSFKTALGYAHILLFLLYVASYIIEIVYLADAVPIRNDAIYICHIDHGNHTELCNFNDNFFNPLVIILAIIVAFASFNLCCVGTMLCCVCIGACNPDS